METLLSKTTVFISKCFEIFLRSLFRGNLHVIIPKKSVFYAGGTKLWLKEYTLAEILIRFRSSRLELFCWKSILTNFTKFTGKHLACNFIKKRLWHRCFPLSFPKFLGTPFLTEHLWWLLLNRSDYCKGFIILPMR